MPSRSSLADNREPALILKGHLLNVELWFLMFKDSSPALNALFISPENLPGYGFQRILAITGVDLDLIAKTIPDKLSKIEIVAIVQEILYESSARTISYLSHHFKHVLQNISP